MTSLSLLQKRFQKFILDDDKAILSTIDTTLDMSSQESMAIYQDGYEARLVEILSNDFPVLRHLMGEDNFVQTMLNYIATYPSQSPSPNTLGQYLQAFLKNKQADTLFIECAECEWAYDRLFFSKVVAPIDAVALQAIPMDKWSSLRFELIPAHQLHSWRVNIPDMWAAHLAGNMLSAPVYSDKSESWLMWCVNREPFYCKLSKHEASLLKALKAGASFEMLCELMMEYTSVDQAGNAMGQLLKRWIDEGLIARVTIST